MTVPRLVLVTGATGFVGRRLVDRLEADGFAVRRALRAPAPPIGGIEDLVLGSFESDPDWRPVLDGVDMVAHLAARVHVRDGQQDDNAFDRVNHLATAQLAEACAAAGVRRFVFLSSVKAALDRTDRTPVPEDGSVPPATAYGRSKQAAEEALRRIADRTGLGVTVLRPPLVYGPGAGGNFRALQRIARSPLPLPLGGIDNRRSLISVDNLIDAIALCLNRDVPFGPYFVADGPPLSTPQIVTALRRALGRTPRLFSVPAILWRLASFLGQRERVDRLLGSLAIDDGAFRAVTGWQPPLDPDRALALAMDEKG